MSFPTHNMYPPYGMGVSAPEEDLNQRFPPSAVFQGVYNPAGKIDESRLFRSSLTSRRFPALRNLTEDDVEVMVLPNRNGPSGAVSSRERPNTKRLFDPELVKPSARAQFSPLSSFRTSVIKGQDWGTGTAGEQAGAAGPAGPRPPGKKAPVGTQKVRPPFSPANPAQARADITQQYTGFVQMYSPFDEAHRQQLQNKAINEQKRVGTTFTPASSSKAKELVRVNYYLNSPDAETIDAERKYIKEKANKNMGEYKKRQNQSLQQLRDAKPRPMMG